MNIRWSLIAGVIVPTWFVVLSAMRLSVLMPELPGYDGMLYREASLRWLAGLDPWYQPAQGAVYGSPPPSLLAMLPFALLPEPVARVALVGLGIVASAWMIRRLRLPLWWLAFPPLVDGLYIANPQTFVGPLLVAGAAPIATLFKVYGIVVPIIRLDVRAVALSLALLLITAPLLPWGTFLERWPDVSAALNRQSAGGGLSVWVTPLLVPVAIAAAVVLAKFARTADGDRRAGLHRLAWLAVPVFWPFTQFYYGMQAIPGLTPFRGSSLAPLAAMALAVPAPGASAIAIALLAAEALLRSRRRDSAST